jgi:hypothetical protein
MLIICPTCIFQKAGKYTVFAVIANLGEIDVEKLRLDKNEVWMNIFYSLALA